MFSPRRSIDRKVDRKAKRERFRRLSDSRDNNIKLNLLGVPKDQVSVKKTHQESKNEDLFKIYIDTQNKSNVKKNPESPRVDKYRHQRAQGYSSEGSTGDFDKPRALGGTDTDSSDPTKTMPNNDICLTLPGEKRRDIKIVRRPSETIFREPMNEQYMQYNAQSESRPNKFQQGKEQTNGPQSDRISMPDRDDGQRNIENIRHGRPVGRRSRKQGPKQVGFSDFDDVYGTGSEESLNSGNDMPFDRRSPMVYQVGGTMAGSAFGGTGVTPSPDPDTTDGNKRGVTNPHRAYESQQPKPHDNQERQPKQLDFTPSPMNEQLAHSVVMDGNLTPQTYRIIKEKPSLNDNIKQSSLNVIGERHPETRSRNVTKPMMVDREVMTDRPIVTSKGNISNVGSNLSKRLPASKNPSKESTDSNRSSDPSKPRKSLVSSIPKPDFGMFRRSKSPKTTTEHGNDPEGQSKTSKNENEDDIKDTKKEAAVNLAHKIPRKLTPISTKDRNYKPIFFPVDTNNLNTQNSPSQLWSKNVMDDQLDNKTLKFGNVEKQTSIDPGVSKLDGEAQATDTMRIPPEKVSVGTSDQISNKTYPSTTIGNDLNKNMPSSLMSYQPWSKNVMNKQLENKSSKPGKVEKQTSIDPDVKKSDDMSQKADQLRFPQDKVSVGKSYEISNKTYPSTTISDDLNKNRPDSLITVDDNVELSPTFNLNTAPMFSASSNYGTPIQSNSDAADKLKTPINARGSDERSAVEGRISKSVENQYDEPYLPELDGYADLTDQEPSYGLPGSKGDMYGAPVDENILMATANILRSTRPSRNTLGPYEESLDPSKHNVDQEGQHKQLGLTPSPLTEQLTNLLMMDGRSSLKSQRKLTEQPSFRVVQKSLSKSQPTSKISLKEPSTHSGSVKDIDNVSILSGLHPNDYASMGAIPRTTSTTKSSKGSLKSGQVWPNVGERLPTRGSPFIETIREEDTDAMEGPYGGPDNNTDQTNEQNIDRLPGYDSKGDIDPNYEFFQANNNINKDQTHIIAFPGHLEDSTPFAYSPSGPGAYPLDYAHPDDTQHEQSTPNHDNATRRPGRKSKVRRTSTGPGKARNRSGVPRGHSDDNLGVQKGLDNSAFGQGPQQEIIYLGKIPNTTYNVFYSPDEEKGPNNIESRTVVPIRSEKMITEGPKGILIFVNKKNDHKCPFKTNGYDDKTTNPNENGETGNKHDDHHSLPSDYGGVRPREGSADSKRDPNKDKKVTVERTSRGKNVTEKFPCGCYRITTFNLVDELQTEAFISAPCTEGSFCEVAHPELAKNKETAYRPSYETEPFRPQERPREAKNIEDTTKRKRPSYDVSGTFPGIEVIADGVVSKKPIKPRPPSKKMKGADLLASLNIKSNKLNGVCNLYFDDRLKRYLRENLTTILADDDKPRSKRLSY